MIAAVKPGRKTLRSLRKNALKMLLEPHVYTYVKVIRGLVTINLGGTAEAVFRPIGGAEWQLILIFGNI